MIFTNGVQNFRDTLHKYYDNNVYTISTVRSPVTVMALSLFNVFQRPQRFRRGGVGYGAKP